MNKAMQSINTFIQQQPVETRRALVQVKPLVNYHAEEQHWGQPYDERYLVLTFPDFEFKMMDLLALSNSADTEENSSDDFIDLIEAQRLHDGTWITTCALSGIQEDIYLHFYFVNEEAAIQHASHQISLKDLPKRSSPETRDGFVLTPHPRVNPYEISRLRSIPTPADAIVDPLFATSASDIPFTKIFLSFDGLTYPQLNCYPIPGKVEEWDYVALTDHDPTSPTDHFGRGWCWASNLTDGIYFNTYLWARWETGWEHKKWHNSNFWTLDLDSAAKMRMWYVRWDKAKKAYVRLGEAVGFRTDYSDWMKDSKPQIGKKKLHEIAIPGTHDAGCFDLVAKGLTAMFSQTQNLDFADQLRYGARYFDIRLYRYDDHRYYFNHGSTDTYTKIDDFVSALETFMSRPGNEEIIIADFSRFKSMQPGDYKNILELFTGSKVLGPLLANEAHTTQTVEELMEAKKRLVLLCDQSSESSFKTITEELGISVFPSINIDAEWPNTSQMTTLKEKLQTQVTNHAASKALWSLQAQLTPIPTWHTMQSVAVTCNAVAARWVQDLWWESVNVVFCDFITGGNLVEVLIDCNRRRLAAGF